MHGKNLPIPSQENLLRTLETLMGEFQSRKFVYLDSKGLWKEHPLNLWQRTNNEFFFQTWKWGPEKRSALSEAIQEKVADRETWMMVKRIKMALLMESRVERQGRVSPGIDKGIAQIYSSSGREPQLFSSLITLDVLIWVIHLEALRLIAEAFVPEWENEAKEHRLEAATELHRWQVALSSSGKDTPHESTLSSFLERWRDFDIDWLLKIREDKAEEEKLLRTLSSLMDKVQKSRDKEEIFALAAEKIQPPQGIVTETSPAFLSPCLKILNNERIPVSSGLPYKASIILSILKDPRSTEDILHAMKRIPLQFTKIRENLIYTLGSLKEEAAVDPITAVLKEPDESHFETRDGEKFSCLLLEQKEEALWALGKIGEPSTRSLPLLANYVQHSSPRLRTYLARALGEMGKAQKERRGGVSVEILIALLKLMQARDKHIFEETVSALRKIEMPHFIHTLYLYNAGAVSILGLLPAQKGLYELSETLHYLLKSKKRVIMAINGDSGTGKTYFCQSLISGFGDLEEKDILYLMRDRKRDQKIFNRILGLKWLRKNVEPGFYENYPVQEEKDDPDAFLNQFFEQNSHKRLFILDGCRDACYFQRVIELLYFKGELDVEVNFRATLSTRRLNLEEREIALESVRTHLDFFEEPALEDTLLYQEAVAILYDLDNSTSSRLSRQEIKELFQKKRIDSWGDLVKIGDFRRAPTSLAIESENRSIAHESFSFQEEKWPVEEREAFHSDEKKFKTDLNEDLISQPNLLLAIPMSDLAPKQIKFYAQNQIAGIGEKGCVFVLTFLDSRLFYASTEENKDICLLGREIFLIDLRGEISSFSFEKNERIRFGRMDSPALVMKSLPRDKIMTGHADGKIRLWNFTGKNILTWKGHQQPVISLASDYQGMIYSSSLDRSIKQWDIDKGLVNIISGIEGNPHHLRLYPKDQKLAVACEMHRGGNASSHQSSKILIFDFKKGRSQAFDAFSGKKISSINVYYDGRIIVTLRTPHEEPKAKKGNLIIIDPRDGDATYIKLDGHTGSTKDSLVMGPRIITCGTEKSQNHTLKIWGTEFYVKMESSKLALQM